MKVTYEDRLKQFKKGWKAGGLITPCGSSTRRDTWRLIEWIPRIVSMYNIKVVNDAGAGDLTWTSLIDWNVDYQGYDVIKRHESVIELDLTKELMRPSDMVLSRMVMIHLSQQNVLDMLKLIRQTSKYLVATNYRVPREDKTDDDSLFWHIRLTDPIYELGEPMHTVKDNPRADLALWRL